MGATNHTTNYNLPQFVGTDKPTWLGDVNGAMSAIDTQMKANATAAATADSKAVTAKETADSASSTATSASTTATNASTTATNALNKSLAVEAEINKFNLSTVIELASPTISGAISGNGNYLAFDNMKMTVARDTTGSVFKLYGAFELINYTFSNGYVYVTFTGTGLSHTGEDYYINCVGIKLGFTPNSSYQPMRAKIKSNGDIEFELEVLSSFTGVRVISFPCIYFNKDFGDSPSN